jgi:NADH-quinone oxidoreductase subunit A
MIIQLVDYNFILIYLLISTILGILFIILPMVLIPRNLDEEKLSAYECGFDPFQDARLKFDIQFYIIAILFIIFDLELIFLLPWLINFEVFGFLGFLIMSIFLILLIIGFIYEWIKKALNWN